MQPWVWGVDDRRRRALAGVVTVAAALILACSPQNGVPLLEQRAQALNQVVMCPVCPGESIDQSQHPLAVQMRGIVEARLADGWSEAQIKSFFVDSYGPRVLLEPPGRGFDLLVWVVPPLAFVGLAATLLMMLRLMTRQRRAPDEGALAGVTLTQEERDQYRERIEALAQSDEPMAPADPRPEAPG